LFALKPSQGPQLITEDWVCGWCALLHAADMQRCRSELDLIPAQVRQF
jgi:hypothetical protein